MPATQHAPRSATRIATSLCVLMLLAGCVAPGDREPSPGPASVSRAELLLRQNNPAAAAQMYEQLAQANPPPDRNEFALAAARAWLAANRADDAQRAIDSASAGLTASQQFERDLVRTEVAMARGQYAPAWQEVSRIAEPPRPADASRLFLLQQQVALRAGQAVEAVRAGVERERLAASDNDRARVRRDLLTDLRSAIERGLRFDPATARDAMVRGWLEIGQIAAAAATSPLGAATAVERWRARFPGHPAATIVASEIITPGQRGAPGGDVAAIPETSAIGLLLPLGSSQAATRAVAALVRDGFLASIARLPAGARPPVRIYDTAATPVATLMRTARAEGVGMLVGPLTRDEVQTAAEQRPPDLPLLLLNNLAASGPAGANLYQYALAPEDEARQIARQMAGQGQRGAMVLTPAGDWGTRVATAFVEELTRAGGHVVARGSYNLSGADIDERVRLLLGLDESRERHEKAERVTGLKLNFEPSPRPEIDAIFAAGYLSGQSPVNPMRQIHPLLHRHAQQIPVYMTQDGLDPDAGQQSSDLSGVFLLDMPWMLETVGPTAELRASTESSQGARGRQSRFFAFGFDAATLAVAIRGGSTTPMTGLTGRITLTPEGRVERSLNWARVASDGSVVPTGATPQ